MPMSAAFLSLPPDVQRALQDRVARKFNAYMRFTQGGSRAVAERDADGQVKHYQYPDDSMIADLGAFWSLFGECREILCRTGAGLRQVNLLTFLQSDPVITAAVAKFVREDGEFWESSGTTLTKIKDADVEQYLPDIWRTLRNGYAHGRWSFGNFAAVDYWTRNGWDTTGAPSAFDLANRGEKNYVAYIVDAAVSNTKPWDGATFWQMGDLRILVTPFGTLRFWLHMFLNILLNGDEANVFDHRPPA